MHRVGHHHALDIHRPFHSRTPTTFSLTTTIIIMPDLYKTPSVKRIFSVTSPPSTPSAKSREISTFDISEAILIPLLGNLDKDLGKEEKTTLKPRIKRRLTPNDISCKKHLVPSSPQTVMFHSIDHTSSTNSNSDTFPSALTF
jgi:hypothetical protein